MRNKTNLPLERIVAKIDNDFNPDNTDWIPRVPAWCFDAMQQLKVLSVEKKRRKLEVRDKVAYSDCCIIQNELKVFDKNGCEIKEAGQPKCCTSSTGELTDNTSLSSTMSITSGMSDVTYGESFTEHNNTDVYNNKHKVYNTILRPVEEDRNYVIISDNQIELNFETDYIYIENLELATTYSEYYKADVPVVPDNGILIEALAYYCMYKMLCRGMKHPVFNLNASQYGTNPYFQWTQLSRKAKTSVINTRQGKVDTSHFQNYFYNYTFKTKG